MASGIGGLLTQKVGPFPGYVWALAVGGAVFFLGPKLLGSSTAGTTGTTATTTTTGPTGRAGSRGATGLQGLMGAIGLPGSQGPPGAAGTSGSSSSPSGSSSSSPWIGTAAPPPPSYWTSQGYDVPAGAADSWNAWKAANPDAYNTWLGTHPGQGGAGGVGGAARNRSASVGSISADPHAYFHPAVKRVPKFPHFVRGGVGGAAPAHAAAVHQIAHQAEIHPARLQMLNMRPHRFVRVA